MLLERKCHPGFMAFLEALHVHVYGREFIILYYYGLLIWRIGNIEYIIKRDKGRVHEFCLLCSFSWQPLRLSIFFCCFKACDG